MPPRRIPPPPVDRDELDAWLTARETDVGDYAAMWLRRIMLDAGRKYEMSLTAGGDLTEIDGVPHAWLQVVTGINNKLSQIFAASGVAAWINQPGVTTPPDAGSSWDRVVNQRAVSYLQDATNRLVKVGDQAWNHLRSLIVGAVERGDSNDQIADTIRNVTNWSEHRARTIARTEAVGAYVNGDYAGAVALGDKGPVEKVWVATRDSRTRKSHAAAHDQVRLFTEMFDVGGHSMEHPHDRSAPASEVINCRCYTEMLYPGDARPDGTIVGEDQLSIEPALDGELGKDLTSYTSDPVRRRFEPLLDDLDRMHNTPGLMRTEVNWELSGPRGLSGEFQPGLKARIQVYGGPDDAEFSFLHEYGHRVDFNDDTRKYFAGEKSDVAERFLKAARSNDHFRDSMIDLNEKDPSFMRYWASREEVWARAYAQYAAPRVSSPGARRGLERMRSESPYMTWPDDVFDAEISPMVESVLRERGLMR